MDQATHNKIVSFIWGIADDVLRDLFKRGKYPDPAQRVADDHLCQVANISRIQWAKLQAVGVDTMARLAALPAEADDFGWEASVLEKLRLRPNEVE